MLNSTKGRYALPVFSIDFPTRLQFRMIIDPTQVGDGKGQHSFKGAGGRGRLQLHCLDEVPKWTNPVVAFKISAAPTADDARLQDNARGPFQHDFGKHSVGKLPAGRDGWDFKANLNQDTNKFVVSLEVALG